MFNVSTVSINESFTPLMGLEVTLHNNMSLKLEYRSTRVINLSMTSVQINEATSNDWVFGMGYKINDFSFARLFGGSKRMVKNNAKKSRGSDDDDSKGNASKSNTNSRNTSGFNHDLNLRFDLSYRKQANISRDIASMVRSASSGNSAFKISFKADYTLSKLLTMTFYFDRQTNTPLLSASSYPTTTSDFGLSLKFSLTR